MTKETYRMKGEPCSIGLVTYTATTKPESPVSKRTNKDNKGYEFTRMVVTTTVRGAKRTNKDNKGYEITRPVVTTAVRRNPKERRQKGSRCSNGCKDIRERSQTKKNDNERQALVREELNQEILRWQRRRRANSLRKKVLKRYYLWQHTPNSRRSYDDASDRRTSRQKLIKIT